MRLATWNVERPKPRGWKIPPAQRERMADVAADIWVLTETAVDYAPGPDYHHVVYSPPHIERRPERERWTAIWSRWPLTPIDDPPPHRRGTVAATVSTPSGPLIVYGTVIAWANERHHDDGRPARMWDVHLAEIDRQTVEWQRLAERHPDVPMVVAGDFNQDRDGSGWYGTHDARTRVGHGLAAARLRCVTDMDAVADGLLDRAHLIDHICVSEAVAESARVSVWESVDGQGRRMSDHPTVAVDIDLS